MDSTNHWYDTRRVIQNSPVRSRIMSLKFQKFFFFLLIIFFLLGFHFDWIVSLKLAKRYSTGTVWEEKRKLRFKVGIEPGTICQAQLGLSLLLIPSPLNKAASLFTHSSSYSGQNFLRPSMPAWLGCFCFLQKRKDKELPSECFYEVSFLL